MTCLEMPISSKAIRFIHLFNHSPNKKEYSARKLIGFSRDQMYTVVADIQNYQDFVPFCTKSTILSQTDKGVEANLEVGFPPIVENYTSKVLLKEPSLVRAICRDGKLLNHLETCWSFSPGIKSNPKTCIVDFHLIFEFKSLLHSQLATIFFDHLVNQMENAFINEAKKRYGKESVPVHKLTMTPKKKKPT